MCVSERERVSVCVCVCVRDCSELHVTSDVCVDLAF